MERVAPGDRVHHVGWALARRDEGGWRAGHRHGLALGEQRDGDSRRRETCRCAPAGAHGRAAEANRASGYAHPPASSAHTRRPRTPSPSRNLKYWMGGSPGQEMNPNRAAHLRACESSMESSVGHSGSPADRGTRRPPIGSRDPRRDQGRSSRRRSRRLRARPRRPPTRGPRPLGAGDISPRVSARRGHRHPRVSLSVRSSASRRPQARRGPLSLLGAVACAPPGSLIRGSERQRLLPALPLRHGGERPRQSHRPRLAPAPNLTAVV